MTAASRATNGDARTVTVHASLRRMDPAVEGRRASGWAMPKPNTIPEPIDAAWAGLMGEAQAGDRRAYSQLLRECTPMIRRVVRRGLADDRVEDAVQEVLLTIHRARHTYDPTRSFTAWVVTISQRRAIDVMRRRGKHDLREVHAPVAYENFAAEPVDLDRDGSLASLDSALSDLPPRQREAIETLALRQMSLDEAASATGNTKGALKVSLHRALKSLRERFGNAE